MAKILVAEDDRGVRSFLVEALELFGHAVTGVADGLAAAAKLKSEDFDLLLSDLRMPGLDGMSLLALARKERPSMQVIVLTAYGTIEMAVEAMKLGAFDFLQKPLSGPEALRDLVERACQQQRVLELRTQLQGHGEQSAFRLSYGDPAMEAVLAQLRKVAPTNATVLLTGESGVGKEVAARLIHRWSERASAPLVTIDCTSIPENLLESELFGHEKGAFTGATQRKAGRIELAEGGTVFLDELGELPLALQSKLLRVIESRQFTPVGGVRVMNANVRWLAATNRALMEEVSKGSFRADLYHRLAVFPVNLPALRERPADIVPLAQTLLARIGRELNRPGLTLGDDACAVLQRHSWPGNVRELRNALERAAIMAEGSELGAASLSLSESASGGGGGGLAELEREAIRQALERAGGHRRRAAEQLGIGLRTLYEKLKRYGLS